MITQEYIKSIFYYNPNTGEFIRIKKIARYSKIGEIAGHTNSKGYVVIKIHQKAYKAHRLAYLYMIGKFPEHQVDHRNRIRDDNRWSNLRLATNSQNQINGPAYKTNTSGYKGVYWSKCWKRWFSQINFNKKQIFLGYHSTKTDAAIAYNKAALEYHGEFAKLNEITK